mgnify:CR=1 FL=1
MKFDFERPFCKGQKQPPRRFCTFIEGFSYFWRNLEFCSDLCASLGVTRVVPDILPVQFVFFSKKSKKSGFPRYLCALVGMTKVVPGILPVQQDNIGAF